ncbi:hypothetical protein NSQ82_18855 [Caldifermentibacillus hisashii]|uniref:hypothetical protein n=1 Tax=Caldifermentibacillus hisashii TaxID=996558 RepID=UPI0031B6B6DA
MVTSPNLVAVLSQETSIFDDESCSRHHFDAENAQFWRRGLFSSPFLVEKRKYLTTSLVLVTIFSSEMLNFGDEGCSRHRFQLKNAQFWRRELISSPFLVEKRSILATRAVLVTVFS